MRSKITLALAGSLVLLSACGGSSNSDRAAATPQNTNNNGTPVNGVLTACFDPARANAATHPCYNSIPLPNNLLLSGTTDLTLNPPVTNANNYGDPYVAISSLDGWGTSGPMSLKFNASPNAASIVAGQSVRIFQVSLTGPGGGVTGISRELAAGTEFVTALSPNDATSMAIVPTKPLDQLTSYLVVVTDGIRDARGNDATPDQVYFFSKRTSPLCANGASTEPLLPTATACALEPVRQLTNSHLAAASAVGINRDKVIASWVFTTQSITPVMQAVRSVTTAGAARLVPTGMTLTQLNPALSPIANVYIGTLTVPYYLSAPTQTNPTAPLTGFWKAAPGAYVPPFNAAGLSPTSTNITFANPFPVKTTDATIPVLATVPNANSGRSKPATGWPVVIFQHGITGNRTHALAVAQTLASQGFAVIAIDMPLHGLPPSHPLAIGNSPFGAIAKERTFDVDFVNNTTGASGPDGIPDESGTHFINLTSLLTSRDNLRQAVADLFVLTASIPTLDIDANGAPDFDSSSIQFVGVSLGAIAGTSFLALEPNVNVGLLSVPGGGIARLLDGSVTFGPRIRAGLAAAGVQAGTPTYDSFMFATQQVVDSIDPINYGFASAQNSILLHEVVGRGAESLPDQVVPNSVPGAPLSGTEPLIRALGLGTITSTTQAANGVRGVVRFTAGEHGSILRPDVSAAVTTEMQRQMASLLATSGTTVVVSDSSVIRAQ